MIKETSEMTNSSEVIKSVFWKAGERILVQGLGIIIQVVLARILLPDDFASLAIINAIISYLGLFVQSGLSVAIVQKKELSDKDISTLAVISLFVALILFICLYILAPYISNYYNVGDLTWPIRVMGISLFLFSFNSIQSGILTRRMKFRTIFLRSLLATPLSGLVGITMAYMGYGIWALVAYSITNILSIVIFMNMIPYLRIKWGFSWQSAKELYSFSLKILGTNLISAGGDTIRTMTIGKVYTPSQLAFYDRAYSYSSLVTQVVNTSLSSVLLPVFSRTQDDIRSLKEMARKSVRLSSFVMIPILVIVAITAKPLVLIVLSEKWLPCAPFLSLFCILRIPSFVTSLDKQVYYALGKSQIGLYYEVFLLAINLVSLVLMIPLGVFYVAIGYTIVEFVGGFVLCLISKKIYGYTICNRLSDLYKPLISCLIMTIVTELVLLFNCNAWITLLSQLIIGVFVYTIMSIMLKDDSFYYVLNTTKQRFRYSK